VYYQKHFGKYITSRDHAYIAKLQSITSICHIIVIRFPSSIAWYGYYSILREIFFFEYSRITPQESTMVKKNVSFCMRTTYTISLRMVSSFFQDENFH
jgi:hypothetical protein